MKCYTEYEDAPNVMDNSQVSLLNWASWWRLSYDYPAPYSLHTAYTGTLVKITHIKYQEFQCDKK